VTLPTVNYVRGLKGDGTEASKGRQRVRAVMLKAVALLGFSPGPDHTAFFLLV